MKRKKDALRLDHGQIVSPSEYDIEGQMQEMVKLANKAPWNYVPLNLEKVVGLYLAWKEQKETIELMLKEQEL